MEEEKHTIDEVARSFGRELFFGESGRIEHVVGVSLRRRGNNSSLNLFIDVDTDEVEILKEVVGKIPSTWQGKKIYLKIVGTPQFA